MRITFLGAAREVTGSCYLIEGRNKRFLVDCGMVQGSGEERNAASFSFDPGNIDFVLLTHAHLDHSGRIPFLYKDGFRGKIFATAPTIELCEVLWLDMYKIMLEETNRTNRKNLRAGKPSIEPLYTEEDVLGALNLFEPVGYDEIVPVDTVESVFRNAAHIIGAATIEVWVDGVKLVFSGDLGPFYNVMEGSPPIIDEADYVILESTYGNRRHKTLEETREEFENAIREALKSGGKVLIPSFVVDRAQRLIYELSLLKNKMKFDFPIFFDSPMGSKATEIYQKYMGLMAGEIQKQIFQGHDPFVLPGMSYVSSPDESRAINQIEKAIVIAGSGMCTGGRIIHHLKHGLWKPNTDLIFVGYQARGTLGRLLVDGAKKIKLFGEEISVKAKINTINGFSAHADQDDLLKWSDYFQSNSTFIITHGEEEIAEAFGRILEKRGRAVMVPQLGDSIELVKKEKKVCVSEVPAVESSVIQEISSKVKSLQEKKVYIGTNGDHLLRSALLLIEEAEKAVMKK
ncbi:MAG TPA: MBL fold hydrolase [Candidatus Atribacteria bacterium]|nr:MBL fold hydrolase [Candidatus Atribacteria bacterium]HCU21837.1 MBL fold hydrolase [Candidatus Atribacteria bacterium]